MEENKLPRVEVFDVLGYWRTSQGRYPLLSKMARDILTIPLSTVASESAFSVGGRVLDAFRSSLKPDIVEATICLRDWLFGQGDDLFSPVFSVSYDLYFVMYFC